ncbi:unnamed protein product [Rotaria sp. Silwood1]|nr:unnamed protein product [Rotaria sp. Silwood1]CAF1109895.1 unnamed protein product [Rotaria sp. Silwood1]CAF3398637.1 unnamed protein product [Rotaria sp. Silwood1]CAF3434842.1 unnamed protein product [Rotaria sp. Silwood1]CAF3672576.1 unnamed protein product [Rotaria sp. Silwood1]
MITSIEIVNIILDSFTIGSAAVAILISISMISIMLFYKLSIKIDRTIHLLSINMYVSLFIGCAIILDIYCYTLYGHLHGNISFDGQWCYIKAYLFHVSGCAFFYSYLLQAVYRLCRIVFYRKPSLQSFKLYIYGIIIQWILSFLQVIPLILLKTFQYLPDDYHCLVATHNIRGLLIILSFVHMIPVTLTTTCYIYTMMYIRKCSKTVKPIRQLANNRRDFIVLTRIFILLGINILSSIPTIIISLCYQFSEYLPCWLTQFQWFTATFSLCCVSFVLIYVSPNLRKLWKRLL